MPTRRKALWTCPKCGHRFVSANMWHSCSRHQIADHFVGKDPLVRGLFDRFRAMIQKCGPVTVYAQKTRIVFQTRSRFAGALPRKHWLDCGLWLKRRVEHPRFRRIESPTPRDHIHHFRVTKLKDLDRDVAALIREAYAVGCSGASRQSLGNGRTAPKGGEPGVD
jgi:hypothetical protein